MKTAEFGEEARTRPRQSGAGQRSFLKDPSQGVGVPAQLDGFAVSAGRRASSMAARLFGLQR